MTPRLVGQDKIPNFAKIPLSLKFQKRFEHKENQTKYRSLSVKPGQGHVRILIYRTWAIITCRHSPVNVAGIYIEISLDVRAP